MKNKELGKGIKALIRDHSTAKKISGQNISIKIKDIIPNFSLTCTIIKKVS